MIGGTMKTSRFALAAAAGLFVGAMAFTPAKAADLGGDCCADLEERVAELEATTVRKGTRVMSVTLTGNVNTGILIWDDGESSDAYVVDNDFSGTDFQINGSAALKPGWTVGYSFDIDVDWEGSSSVNAEEGDGHGDDLGASGVELDDADVYIESERWGRISMGHGDMASDGIAEISLSSAGNNYHCGACINGGFEIVNGAGTWGDGSSALDGFGDVKYVRYDTPSIYGFILSASAGEDDLADVALRFSKQWNSVQFAAGVAYGVGTEVSKSTTETYEAVGSAGGDVDYGDEVSFAATTSDDGGEFEQISGSASIKHVPTGLYAIVSAGEKDYDDAGESDETAFYGSIGISKNFFGPGDTSFYGEYATYDGFGDEDNEIDRFGLGFAQDFDSAATEIFIHAEHWEQDDADAEEWTGVMTGMNVSF